MQGSDDPNPQKDLKLPTAGLIVRKGFREDVDSYSALVEAGGKTMTAWRAA